MVHSVGAGDVGALWRSFVFSVDDRGDLPGFDELGEDEQVLTELLGECRQSASDGDDELSSGVPLLQLPDGLGDLAQRVGPVNDRRELAGLDELPQDHQVVLARLGGQHPQPLTNEP